ncbi:MAG: DUF3667 domain-containing protein [Colwellia sp.]|nr:DUF3667 domain-containing protein [Colwellia sp.]
MTQKLSADIEQKKLTNSEEHTKTCENCHTQVSGLYCGTCGQSVESTLKYFWAVILHLLDDILSFDSRASRTLFPLLFRPGFLTNEYIKGRRVHYVPPLRLYLFISIVFFITLKFIAANNTEIQLPNHNAELSQRVTVQVNALKEKQANLSDEILTNNQKSIEQLTSLQKDLLNKKNKIVSSTALRLLHIELNIIDDGIPLSEKNQDRKLALLERLAQAKQGVKLVEDKLFNFENNDDGTFTFSFLSDQNNKKLTAYAKVLEKKAEQTINSDIRPLIKESISKLPQLMFILLPLFALLLKITYLFKKRLYLEHLTVALHSHSFIFLSILLLLLCDKIQDATAATYPLIGGIVGFLNVILVFWLPIYLFKTQKHVYKQGFLLTFLKYSFVGIVYMMLIFFTGVIAFIWGLTDV